MMQSEQVNELAAALTKAQAKIEAAVKDSKNPFFKSAYASLNSVWDACREPLTENGLAVVQTMAETEKGTALVTTLMHQSGQWIRGEMLLRAKEDSSQAVGSAITYARRYGLAAIVGIVTDEDDDGQAASQPAKPQKSQSQKNEPESKSANGGKPAPPTSATELLKLVNNKVQVPYDNLSYMLNGIRQKVGNKGWQWPAADDAEGWRKAYQAAKDYADGKTQPAGK